MRDESAWIPLLPRAGGTIFVDRERRLASPAVVDLIRDAIAGRSLVVLFPEGTSSNGSTYCHSNPRFSNLPHNFVARSQLPRWNTRPTTARLLMRSVIGGT
jgi:1-acyl-sn-glycerol-3-phosphate acyltransferase